MGTVLKPRPLVATPPDIQTAASTLRAAYAALPTPTDMAEMIGDSQTAEVRGYYDPVEDERLRAHYARYLGIRSAIWDAINALHPKFKSFKGRSVRLETQELQIFAIAFAGAEIIVRTGEYLIDLAKARDIVWKKLDEAEMRYGIPAKRFTRLYRQLTSTRRMRPYYAARDYFDAHRDDVMNALNTTDLASIRAILTDLNLPGAVRGDHLRRYGRFVGFSLRRRRLSTTRQILFDLFEVAGSDIADLKIPLVKPINAPKRMTGAQVERLKTVLRPGDVFVTRHDDALSNLFLPGFWPHSALYIGHSEDRAALGEAGLKDVIDDGRRQSSDPMINVLEAKKDGVLLRAIEETLEVDACVVLRPNLSAADIHQALSRGLSHAGKLYDFIFDFSTADRLVCTEVIYRAYHGVGPVQFDLSIKAGRHCLSAEDLLNQGISNGWFTPIIACNFGGTDWAEGQDAHEKLQASFEATF